MSIDARQFEARFDAELRRLPPLDAPPPGRAVVERVVAAVEREADRLRAGTRAGRGGRLRLVALSWAAALFLSVGLGWSGRGSGRASGADALDAAQSLAEWTAALDQSARAVALVGDDDWAGESATLDDARRGLRDFMESVDESLGQGAS